jgi:hypothetical protein
METSDISAPPEFGFVIATSVTPDRAGSADFAPFEVCGSFLPENRRRVSGRPKLYATRSAYTTDE